METALIVIDVQQGFADPVWGARNNPDAEANIEALQNAWRGPLVLVRHDSVEPGSPLRPDQPGNALQPFLDVERADLVFGKSVNSAFHGEVDLDGWLRERGVEDLVLVGIQTNMCVETSTRVAGNLGYRATLALDATYTFDLEDLTADQLYHATEVNLRGGGFARIASTAEVLAGLR
ncbi:cysteine hydrolase [Actinosynnema pretiosum subsp. pretiosum]|uniref:Isochorismatase hydrolase n=2 Tax=Actinosynnema TaxID=40566 RepID=C6WHI6_ACTMD|nr:cysteine hydrolase family protein [Actinosynnema mirum]ACU39935.1 isochorismatase hydrolase [Actinosynnema mirum DSM 43827]QUF02745.1 cysteine hydrolase [Actinosynnema pretiosum subsp. pretiosum]